MAFVAEKLHAPVFEFNQPEIQVVEQCTYNGREHPSAAAFSKFQFEQRIIPLEGGRNSLRLSKPLSLDMNFDTMRFTVSDWGIELDSLELPALPREIARHFLRLLNAAENDRLTPQEKLAWLKISDYVDFSQFSIERAPARYMEGVLCSNAEVFIIEWHDGNKERLNHRVTSALSEVNVGEKFSAFVKLGKDDSSIAIERVSLLPAPDVAEDWESWPEKA